MADFQDFSNLEQLEEAFKFNGADARAIVQSGAAIAVVPLVAADPLRKLKIEIVHLSGDTGIYTLEDTDGNYLDAYMPIGIYSQNPKGILVTPGKGIQLNKLVAALNANIRIFYQDVSIA